MQIINSSRRGRSVLASPSRSLAFAATFALMFAFASASASASASAFAFAYAFAFALAVASALGLLSASAVVAADNSRPTCRDACCVSHFWHVLCVNAEWGGSSPPLPGDLRSVAAVATNVTAAAASYATAGAGVGLRT